MDFKPQDDAWDVLVVDIDGGTYGARLTTGGGSDLHPPLDTGRERRPLQLRAPRGRSPRHPRRYGDVSADGETFYMIRATGEPPRRISIITSFFEVLREGVGG